MKKYNTSDIRNIGLFSDGGVGKTTLAEAFLFNAKVTDRMGSVEKGNAVMDYDPQEQKRGRSLGASLASFFYKNKKVNLLDPPGTANFITDAAGVIRVVDGGLFLVSAVDGVRVQTDKLWHEAVNRGIPRFLFVNEMDKSQADFEEVLEDIKKTLEVRPVILSYPIGEGDGFKGVVDLVSMKAHLYDGDKLTVTDIPDEVKAKAEELHESFMEDVAECDDELMEKYLEEHDLSPEEITTALKKGVHDGILVPLLCGSAVKNMGTHLLMDTLMELVPSPDQMPPVKGKHPETGEEMERACSPDEPFLALVFKTFSDPYAGKISLFRVFAGSLGEDTTVLNVTRDTKERLTKPFFLVGKEQQPVNQVPAGDIAAVAKLKETKTGDVLCDPANPMTLEPIEFPPPVLSAAIKAKAKADEDKISNALQRLMEEDPGLQVERHEQTKELILAGRGQLHLEVTVDKMKEKFGVEVELQTPKVPYKETVKGKARVQGRYKKQTGGRGQFGDVWIELEPLPRGAGFEFVDEIVGGAIPRQYIPSVEKGIREAMMTGILAGYPVVDFRIRLVDGSFHPVDSSDMAFKIAGSMAFKKAVEQAKPVLLEPIMDMEVIVPEECIGDVMGSINAKRGKIQGVEAKGKNQVVKALVPLAEVLRYAPELRSITGGRGTYSMVLSHYEEVPAQIAQKIIEEAKKETEE